MEGDNTGFNAKAQEEQHKRSGLLSTAELGCDGTEAREFGAAAGVDQQSEAEKQAPGIDMGHDDVEQTRSSGLPVFVVERHQPVSGKRHYFPCNQKQEGIRSGKDDRQAEK